MTVSQIEHRSLHQVIASQLRDMIIEGTLEPGEQINELKLCETLGVSRTPMREAVRILTSEGLITERPRRSSVVRKFTPEEVQDMLNVISEMEVIAGRLACSNASDEAIAEIDGVHQQMLELYRIGDRLPYFKLNQQIHSMMVAAAGSPTLSEVHELLQARMKRIRYIGLTSKEEWRAAIDEHEEMLQALKSRDEERLVAVIRKHISNTWHRVGHVA